MTLVKNDKSDKDLVEPHWKKNMKMLYTMFSTKIKDKFEFFFKNEKKGKIAYVDELYEEEIYFSYILGFFFF